MFLLKSTSCTAAILAVALVGFFSPNANGASYTFTGSATVDASTAGDAHLSGPNLDLTFLSMQSTGPNFYGCSAGPACLPQFTISGQMGASPAVAFGAINGTMAAQIRGGLTLASPPFTVDGAPPGPFTLQEPLTVTGSLLGIDPSANVLFSVDVNGVGTTDLIGTASKFNGTTIVNFTKVAFSFSGNVTDTPEPSSAILLGTGLLVGGAGLLRRRRVGGFPAITGIWRSR